MAARKNFHSRQRLIGNEVDVLGGTSQKGGQTDCVAVEIYEHKSSIGVNQRRRRQIRASEALAVRVSSGRETSSPRLLKLHP